MHSPQVWCTLSPPRSQPQFPRTGSVCRVSSGELISGCDTPGGYQPPRISGSLVRDWQPVCSLVGDALSGAEFAPFPSPMPPASGGRWPGPQLVSSSLVFT